MNGLRYSPPPIIAQSSRLALTLETWSNLKWGKSYDVRCLKTFMQALEVFQTKFYWIYLTPSLTGNSYVGHVLCGILLPLF